MPMCFVKPSFSNTKCREASEARGSFGRKHCVSTDGARTLLPCGLDQNQGDHSVTKMNTLQEKKENCEALLQTSFPKLHVAF